MSHLVLLNNNSITTRTISKLNLVKIKEIKFPLVAIMSLCEFSNYAEARGKKDATYKTKSFLLLFKVFFIKELR